MFCQKTSTGCSFLLYNHVHRACSLSKCQSRGACVLCVEILSKKNKKQKQRVLGDVIGLGAREISESNKQRE